MQEETKANMDWKQTNLTWMYWLAHRLADWLYEEDVCVI